MRALFSDPQGPRLWRMAPYAGPVALFFFAFCGLFETFTAMLVAGTAFGLFQLVGLLPMRQGRLRPSEVVAGPGYIDIQHAGTRSQRIHAKDIEGGTTARTANGVLFTLTHRKRDQPIALEVASDADAEKVRHALGIGHGGFGSVAWRTSAGSSAKAGITGRIITFVAVALCIALGMFVSDESATQAAALTFQFTFIGMILSLIGYFGRSPVPSVTMAAEGLKLVTRQGMFTVPYDHVLRIEKVDGALRFIVPPPYNFVDVVAGSNIIGPGLGPDDRDGLTKQIMSASARARGLGKSKEDVTGRVDVLRRNGESPRDWLARLDMAGRLLESSAAGYRGQALDQEDLWMVLEDPEADAELRSAAARVLRHSHKPETRVRIDAAVAAVRDEGVNRRLRIAVNDDVDNASQELAVLDATDPLPGQRAMYYR